VESGYVYRRSPRRTYTRVARPRRLVREEGARARANPHTSAFSACPCVDGAENTGVDGRVLGHDQRVQNHRHCAARQVRDGRVPLDIAPPCHASALHAPCVCVCYDRSMCMYACCARSHDSATAHLTREVANDSGGEKIRKLRRYVRGDRGCVRRVPALQRLR